MILMRKFYSLIKEKVHLHVISFKKQIRPETIYAGSLLSFDTKHKTLSLSHCSQKNTSGSRYPRFNSECQKKNDEIMGFF